MGHSLLDTVVPKWIRLLSVGRSEVTLEPRKLNFRNTRTEHGAVVLAVGVGHGEDGVNGASDNVGCQPVCRLLAP